MRNILVTGSRGFIGRNLIEALSRRKDARVMSFDSVDDESSLASLLEGCDIVYHLAGVNRPERDEEFEEVNVGLTRRIASVLGELGSKAAVVLASSTQAEQDNPYGVSKRRAEEVLIDHASSAGAPVYIYRLTNVFGKWSRPDYNSVVSTFCHNMSHGLDISISDPAREMTLVYIDDVIKDFTGLLDSGHTPGHSFREPGPQYSITLGALVERLTRFRDIRSDLRIPDLADDFSRRLYATFLSYYDPRELSYEPETRADERGELVELMKSENFGQIFVSSTRPGVTRGNHYHDTKIEKFIVLKGEAVVRLRHILEGEVISYEVSGARLTVIDIPPGYTHSIENVSDDDMVVMFWSDEIYDNSNPDTYALEVID